jgi:hypothetical protein
MDRDTFVGLASPSWWLLELESNSPLVEKRNELGRCWGWDDPQWFGRSENLGAVLTFLIGIRGNALLELDDVRGVDAYGKWLDELIDAKTRSTKDIAMPTAAPEVKRPDLIGAAGANASEATAANAAEAAAPKKVRAFDRGNAQVGTPDRAEVNYGKRRYLHYWVTSLVCVIEAKGAYPDVDSLNSLSRLDPIPGADYLREALGRIKRKEGECQRLDDALMPWRKQYCEIDFRHMKMKFDFDRAWKEANMINTDFGLRTLTFP